MIKKNIIYLQLNVILVLYSISTVCSKCAAQYAFCSVEFIVFFGGALFLLFVYAILWQQILKKIAVTTAYGNKAMVVVWGMIWGSILFKETITLKMIFGAMLILLGVYWVVSDD